MPTKALFEECMEPVKKDFPANYGILMQNDLKKWTHHATPSNLVNLKMSTSNSAESTINAVGHQVGERNGWTCFRRLCRSELTHYAIQEEHFALVLNDGLAGWAPAQRQAADVGSRVGLHRSQRFVKPPTVDHCSSEFSLLAFPSLFLMYACSLVS